MTKICSFCLKFSNVCSAVDENIKQTMELIFIHFELLITESSIICKECIQRLHSASDLKAASICNENLMCYEINKPGQENLVEVYLKRKKMKCGAVPNESTICRFCINLIPDNYFYSLEDMEVDMNIRDIVIKHLPEVDFTITSHPMVCQTCLKKLQDYGIFINSWLNINNLKQNYLVCNNKTDISDLNEVRKFILDTNIGSQHSDNYDIHNTIEFDNGAEENEKNIDCVVDNIQLKDDFEVHDELKYPAEHQIKIESISGGVELRKDGLTQNDDFEINESKVETEILQFKPKMESDDYVLKEEEISITDVKNDDSTEFEDYPERDLDVVLLCNNIQGTRQQKSSECSSEHKEFGPNSFTNFFPKMEQERLLLTNNSMEQLMESRNSAYRLIKINDGFRCGLCPFQNQLEAQVKEHFENCSYSKYNHLNLEGLVDSEESILYKCANCDYKSKQKLNLKRHLIKHSDATYKCEHCDYESKQKRNLKVHLIKHSGATYKCEHCDYESKYKYHLERHTLKHSDECIFYKCDHCDYKAKQKGNLKTHSEMHSDSFYKCEHCNYETKQKNQLKRHLVIHSGKSILYKCEHCDFESKYKIHLKTHLLRHFDEYNYKCEHCNYKSKQKHQLKRHLVMHSCKSILYKCEDCDYESKYKGNFKTHLLKHLDECIYKCEHCDYETKRKENLKVHLIVHSDESKLYKCEHCEYKTKFKNNLKSHLLVHSDGCKLYKCENCDYKTKYKYYLKVHLLKHSDECVFYKCDLCNYKTKRKNHLKTHLMVHSDKRKRYECEHCDYKTNYKNDLKLHLIRHSND